jgi:hypothetical protein
MESIFESSKFEVKSYKLKSSIVYKTGPEVDGFAKIREKCFLYDPGDTHEG